MVLSPQMIQPMTAGQPPEDLDHPVVGGERACAGARVVVGVACAVEAARAVGVALAYAATGARVAVAGEVGVLWFGQTKSSRARAPPAAPTAS